MADVLTLADHLRRAGAQPFSWGSADCCLMPSDWMRARRGVDPAGPLRGRYCTALGAARHIRRLGGFEAMVRRLMTSAGFVETDRPAPGDVGVVEGDGRLALAIRTACGWAVKGERGITVAPFRCVRAWTV